MQSRSSGLVAMVLVAMVLALVASGLVPASAAVGAVQRGSRAPTCLGMKATVVGTPDRSQLVGTPGPDVIVGSDGNDKIDGRGGDDVVCGRGGADRINGGPGDDRLDGGADRYGGTRGGTFLAGDVLRGGPGDDRLDVGFDGRRADVYGGNTVSYRLAPRGVRVSLVRRGFGRASGEGDDLIPARPRLQVRGSSRDDVITGSQGPDVIDAGAGRDRIDTRRGDDEVFVDMDGRLPDAEADDPTDDSVDLGAGDDTVSSASGRDSIDGGSGDDYLESLGEQAVVLTGGPGDDTMVETLTRESGWSVDGGPGRDTVAFSTARPLTAPRPDVVLDLRIGASSVDYDGSVYTGTVRSTERLDAGDVRLTFYGTSASEVLDAFSYRGPVHAEMGDGDDKAFGSDGDDYLDGGLGDDKANGFNGDDVCPNTERQTSCP